MIFIALRNQLKINKSNIVETNVKFFFRRKKNTGRGWGYVAW